MYDHLGMLFTRKTSPSGLLIQAGGIKALNFKSKTVWGPGTVRVWELLPKLIAWPATASAVIIAGANTIVGHSGYRRSGDC